MSTVKLKHSAKSAGGIHADSGFRAVRGGSADTHSTTTEIKKMKLSSNAPLAERTAKSLRLAILRREEKQKHTYGLYTICRKGNKHWHYMPPFLSVSDDCALNAVIEMAHTEPSLCGDNLYRIADFCSLDGKIKALKNPSLIVHKSKCITIDKPGV